MSELTPCNCCSLKRIKARAKQDGNRVVVRAGGIGNIVYVMPKDVTLKQFNALDEGDWDAKTGKRKYCTSEMMEISQSCCC